MTLPKTTKVALRVALSLSLSMVVVEYFHLPHALWVFFVATSTAAGSLGLSVQRSWQRALMTVAGSLVGGGLHLLLHEVVWTEKLLFALALFFAAYYLPHSYTLYLFFIAILFVSIVGLREAFSIHELVLRVVDTLVGAGCALIASLTVFPMRASDLLRSRLERLVEVCQRRFRILSAAFLTQTPDMETIGALEEEARGLFGEAHKALSERKYERIFGNFFPRNGGLLLTQLEHLATLLRGLTHTVRKPTSQLALDSTGKEVEMYGKEIEGEFETALAALKAKHKAEISDETEKIRRQILLKVLALMAPDRGHVRQWLNYHTYLNYLYRIEKLLKAFTARIT